MNTLYIPGKQELSGEQLGALHSIRTAAMQQVEDDYGTGYPDFIGGENGGLSFHGLHHTIVVESGTKLMGIAMGLGMRARALGATAASAHDVIQKKERGVMERESALWLGSQMRSTGLFIESDIELSELAVEGTEPIIEDGLIVGQMASLLEYPSYEAELVAKGVSCGDFGEMYAPSGPLMSHLLFKEILGYGANNNVEDLGEILEKQRKQQELVESFTFAHPLGEAVFGRLRPQVVKYTAQVTRQLEQGAFDTLDHLLCQDEAFMLQHI